MINKKIYPIGTKVNVGENKGMITSIKFLGGEYAVVYMVFWLKDGDIHEKWLYDIEFTTSEKKITVGLKICINGQ